MSDITMQYDSLTMKLMAFLGNESPSKKQIKVMESILFSTGLKTQLFFNNKLTKREVECLNLAALGYSSTTTAEILKISKKTVEEYRNEIKKKLGCKSIAQAVFQGIKYGYVVKPFELPHISTECF